MPALHSKFYPIIPVMSIPQANGCPRGQSIALDRRARAAILYSVQPCGRAYLIIYTPLRRTSVRAELTNLYSLTGKLPADPTAL